MDDAAMQYLLGSEVVSSVLQKGRVDVPRDSHESRESRSSREPRGWGGSTPRVLRATGLHSGDCPKVKFQAFSAGNLRRLFGLGGDIMRIRIPCAMFSEALLEFRNSDHAASALRGLREIQCFGTTVKLEPCSDVAHPLEPAVGEMESERFVDFSQETDHRFGEKFPSSKIPSRHATVTLYLYNLPRNPPLSKEELHHLFEPYGCIAAEVFERKPGEGRVEFASVVEATECLVWTQGCTEMAGTKFTERGQPTPLRVTFADKTVNR
eukprot:Hpha_TRINITY_DN16173_c1_g5::TRINITY_DN16173_c1_g5_i1::g.4326::m.4326